MSNVKLDTLSAGTHKLSSGGVDFDVKAYSQGEMEAVVTKTGDYAYANVNANVFAMAKDLNGDGVLGQGDSVVYSWGDPHFNQVTLTGQEGSSLKDIVAFYGYVTDFDVQSNYILHTKTAQALVDTEVWVGDAQGRTTLNDKITWEVAGANGGKGALSFDFNDKGGIDMGVGQLVTRQSLLADPNKDAVVDLFYNPELTASVFIAGAGGRKSLVNDGAFVNRAGQEINDRLVAPDIGEFKNASGTYFGAGNNEGFISETAVTKSSTSASTSTSTTAVNVDLNSAVIDDDDDDEDEDEEGKLDWQQQRHSGAAVAAVQVTVSSPAATVTVGVQTAANR